MLSCAQWMWLRLSDVCEPWVNAKYSTGFTWRTADVWESCALWLILTNTKMCVYIYIFSSSLENVLA